MSKKKVEVADLTQEEPEVIADSTDARRVLRVKRLPHGATLPEIAYQSANAAGIDLYAAIPAPLKLKSGGRLAIPTGVSVEIPIGYEGQVRPRSGLAINKGVTVLNAPGTIDADYRGEIMAILINTDNSMFYVEPGMRVAQLVIAPVVQLPIHYVEELSSTSRGAGGLGSTGLK